MTHHWQCKGQGKRNLNQNIYLSYCREHDEILLQYEGTVIVYQDAPVLVQVRDQPSLFQYVVVLLSMMAILWLVWQRQENIDALPQRSTNVTVIPLRTQYFSMQHENMKTISTTVQYGQYETSILHHIIQNLMTTANHLQVAPSCLCHHHLDRNASINGIYAPVCIIPLGHGHWQAIVNPKSMSMDDLYRYHSDVIITRQYVDERTSLILKPEMRHRHNTFGLYSMWPALTNSIYYHQPLREHWILYDETARCMALALDEIYALLNSH